MSVLLCLYLCLRMWSNNCLKSTFIPYTHLSLAKTVDNKLPFDRHTLSCSALNLVLLLNPITSFLYFLNFVGYKNYRFFMTGIHKLVNGVTQWYLKWDTIISAARLWSKHIAPLQYISWRQITTDVEQTPWHFNRHIMHQQKNRQ